MAANAKNEARVIHSYTLAAVLLSRFCFDKRLVVIEQFALSRSRFGKEKTSENTVESHNILFFIITFIHYTYYFM